MNKVVGLLLDVSLRHTSSGERILDVVKDQLSKFLNQTMDYEDAFYFYHPLIDECVYKPGEMIGIIGNYETDGYKFPMEIPLRQTLYIVTSEDEDFDKIVYVFTDRLNTTRPIKDFLTAKDKDNLDCKICVVGIGELYDREGFSSLAEEEDLIFLHSSDPSLILDLLLEETNGKD